MLPGSQLLVTRQIYLRLSFVKALKFGMGTFENDEIHLANRYLHSEFKYFICIPAGTA